MVSVSCIFVCSVPVFQIKEGTPKNDGITCYNMSDNPNPKNCETRLIPHETNPKPKPDPKPIIIFDDCSMSTYDSSIANIITKMRHTQMIRLDPVPSTYYVCATCYGSGCSDCNYFVPDYVVPTWMDRDGRKHYGKPIKNPALDRETRISYRKPGFRHL